jgi:ABC-type glycerol-3-phosphate transport system permease component
MSKRTAASKKSCPIFEKTGMMLLGLLLVFAVIVALFPAVWMVLSSIKMQSELFTVPPAFFARHPTFENYGRVIFKTNIPRSFLNSLFNSSVTMLCTGVVALFAAYGFSRFDFPLGKMLSTGLLFGQMMPAIVLLIPLFRIYSVFKLIDTYQVNIISNVAVNMPMAVLTMTAFMRTVPRELDDAAMIDGCMRSRALFEVIAPVCTPGVATICIFSFLNTWEEFIFAFNFTNSMKYKTLTIALKDFKGQFIIDWGGMMSAALVITIPVLFVFFLCNKYFIRGIASGAVKG